ncbi:methyltransferase domain-containing protein [Shewanella gelidii]|uniref:Type 11 methyltransferase n=1 Tax=Shewanella gelidii TaxID=1642821 RepID=A0A917NBU2_9GAMM|nr:methyltransferase domain-containing protein [Shewanella gelidii]MCL1098607.1 class I SAM-dependent methyltransferase [Shewanella gelidii]GGI86684.1 type 11 methyltransferase [Shewanella gelidii]
MSDHVNHSPRACKPIHWGDLPSGELVQANVQDYLETWWPKVFGYHLLKLGELSAGLNSMQCSIPHQVMLFEQDFASVIGRFENLPLQNSCIDAALMTLLLEFEDDPYRILRELDRVIISGGYLFIVGINPLSSIFFGKMWPKYQARVPWCGHFFTPARVKDWLGLLGYQVVADERMVFHSLLKEANPKSIWQHTLEAWLPNAGSFYVLVARKLDSPLTPVRQKRKVRQTKWSPAPTAGKATPRSKS